MSNTFRDSNDLSELVSASIAAEGETLSSRNAVVTNLTGRTVLLASDDVDEYIFHLARHHAEYLPITDAENEVVQTIADCDWRLRRIITLETGIDALGERQFAGLFPGERRDVRNTLIKAQTHVAYQRQLSDLATQESRLQGQKSEAIAALDALRKDHPQKPLAVHTNPGATTRSAAVGLGDGFGYTKPVA